MHVTRVPLSIQTYDSVVKIHGMVLASFQGNLWYVLGRLPCMHCLNVVEKDVGMGLCLYVDFAFMHHLCLVCMLFGMPSLHPFTFLMFFIFLYNKE